MTLEVTAIVDHTRLGTLSEYTKCKFRSMAHTGQTYHVTLCVSRPVTPTFDLLTLKPVRNAARVMGYSLPILVILRLFIFDLWAIGPTRPRLIT